MGSARGEPGQEGQRFHLTSRASSDIDAGMANTHEPEADDPWSVLRVCIGDDGVFGGVGNEYTFCDLVGKFITSRL